MDPRVPALIDKHFGTWEHPYRRFEREVDSLLRPEAALLDVGCGRTAPVLQKYQGRGYRLIGIDSVDFSVSIPGIQLINADIAATKLPASSIDVIMARSVMEHVQQPSDAYKECFRILKPGGMFIFLTANMWDYATLIARAVPNWLHPRIVRKVEGRAECDVFPTAYQTNTRRRIYSLAEHSGLIVRHFEYLGQYPPYLLFSAPLFMAGTAYEKFIARYRRLHFLRGWILAVLTKPQTRTA